jgi:PAS domain S-box-containing protein
MQKQSLVSDQIFELHDSVLAITKAYVKSLASSEKKLKEHIDVLDSMIQSVGAGLVVVSPDLEVILINQSALQLMGLKAADNFSGTLDEFYADGYQQYLADGVTPLKKGEELVVQAMKRRETMEAELLLRGPSLPEEGIWLRASAAPIINEDGELLGSVGVYHDITELKSAYMRVSELYNTAPCGYQSLDADGTILEINNTLLKLIGYKRDEVLQNLKFDSLLSLKSQEIFAQNLPRLARLETVSNIQLELHSSAGDTYMVLWSAKPIKSREGNFLYSSCTVYDITQTKTMESQRDALAAIITHDIKNHLIAGGQVLQMLFLDTPERVSEEDRSLVTSMLVANDQYLNLSSDLLHLYRTGHGHFELSFEQLNLRAIIKEVVELNSASASLMNVALLVEADQSAVDTVYADGPTISRVFHNLVHNALRFSPPGGQVRICIRKQHNQVLVDVIDEGPGMTPDVVDSLFQPFWTTKIEPSQYTSTRLGLYLCRSILEMHHGFITAQSKVGFGSTFSVGLPATSESMAEASPTNS